jgi:hypothetical protein
MTDTEILNRLDAAMRTMDGPMDLCIGTFWTTIGPGRGALREALLLGLVRDEPNIAKRVAEKLTS